MHAFLNFYRFLWKNKTVFFFFMTLIPLTSFLYLQQKQQKFSSIIEVKNYDFTEFENDYTAAKVMVKNGAIYVEAYSEPALKEVKNEIIGDVSYTKYQKAKHELKTSGLKVAALLEKKKTFDKLAQEGIKFEQEQYTVVDNLYKSELAAYEQANINYESYSPEQDIKITNLQNHQPIAYKFTLSFLLAFVIAVLASLIRSFFNSSLDNELEIKKITSLKAMEGLPRLKKLEIINNKLVANRLKVHSLTEISRIFKYISARDRKVFEIVSSVKNEGNSSLVYALAQHAAENGSKVLLLDMNLRNMELSIKVTKTIETWGIADGKFDKLDEKTIKLAQNLDFLPALKDAKSLEYLKTTKNLKALMEYLKSKYDYIFIDTTAVFSVNINNIDSVILAEAVDGVLINYLANRTKKRILLETIDKMNMAESNILGIVTNNRYNPKLKEELLAFCSYLEKLNKGMADNLRLRILKSYLLDEE